MKNVFNLAVVGLAVASGADVTSSLVNASAVSGRLILAQIRQSLRI